jgi:copper chaperone CopZ
MKKFIIIMMLLPTLVFAQKVVVSVPGMVCQMCVHGMQKNFKTAVENPEKDVVVDLDKKTVTVNLKEKITEKEIKKRVADAGYNAEKITWIKE